MTLSMAMNRAFAGQPDEARQGRRDHQQFGHRLGLLAPVSSAKIRLNPPIGDERERMRRVDRLRGQHRQDLLAEMVGEPLGLGA
jgi:hypothetical protein